MSDIKQSDRYPVAICNSIGSKQFLLFTDAGRRLLEQWHVIRLTRRDKVAHFISHYFWFLNPGPVSNSEEAYRAHFGHNNTDHEVYANFVKQSPVHMPVQTVLTWLQEQMIINYLPYHSFTDYEYLHEYSANIAWTPNRYQDIGLADLFSNHEEISELLRNYPSAVYP